MKRCLWIAALGACAAPEGSGDWPPPDLTAVLGPGEVRAGVVTRGEALFGGIAAEGRVGDVKLYNDRVQFVIQGVRPGSFYVSTGGSVIDADIVRPDGELGRDVIEEWGPMYGLGRLLGPDSVEVVRDGREPGSLAVVRATGVEVPLTLIEGALEVPGFVPDLGLSMTTEYLLQPDSWLLEVRSTVTASDTEAVLQLGDVIMGAQEVARTWLEGVGMGDDDGADRRWMGYVSDRNDVAVAVLPGPGTTVSGAGYQLLTELAEMVPAFGPDAELQPGESLSYTRYYGVGPDLATLTDAALELQSAATDEIAATVTAPDGPVAGARATVLVDGAPFTAAVTAADGSFSARVPAGSTTGYVVDGRGTGRFADLPDSAVPYSAYAAEPVRSAHLGALAAAGGPTTGGRGVSAPDTPTLGAPAELRIEVGDGLPFSVRVAHTIADPPVDEAVVLPRPGGYAATGWSRDGALTLLVEPGTYDVLVHRGMRFEYDRQTTTVDPGSPTVVTASLPAAYAHPGWILADPHSHASPSADGELSMEDRLITMAASGIQVHFGTDHDHLVDYGPLLEALGLSDVLATVVANEVSPPLRGHMNIYPVASQPLAPNSGAWSWWDEPLFSTEAIVDELRERHGPEFVLQLNHPTDSGVASAADWTVGRIGNANRWHERFGAVEVLNAGSYAYLDFWLDMYGRGILATPTGVSDAHGHRSGHIGVSATFLGSGSDRVADFDDATLVEVMTAGRTIVSRGVFLDLSVPPGGEVPAGSELQVTARAPSWAQPDRLLLLRDGVEVDRVDGTAATFTLDATADAFFVVVAEGDTAMEPVDSRTPWALSGAYRVDVGSDGWTPPLPPLSTD